MSGGWGTGVYRENRECIVPINTTHRCFWPRVVRDGVEMAYEDTPSLSIAAVLLFNGIGELALVERAQNQPVEPGKYALPGGYVKQYQTIDNAAKEETREETGYLIEEGTLEDFAIMDGPTHLPGRAGEIDGNIVNVYLAKAGEEVQNPDEEISGVIWVNPQTDLPRRGRMAFGHYDIVGMYLRHLTTPFPRLPIRPSRMSPEELLPAGWVLRQV